MTLTQGRTETNDTQATIDDVEGHRIAPFVEDYKDDALGRRRSPDDIQGRRRLPFVDETDEVIDGHRPGTVR